VLVDDTEEFQSYPFLPSGSLRVWEEIEVDGYFALWGSVIYDILLPFMKYS